MSDEGASKYDFYVQIFNSPEHYSPDDALCKICVHCAVKSASEEKWIDEKSKLCRILVIN